MSFRQLLASSSSQGHQNTFQHKGHKPQEHPRLRFNSDINTTQNPSVMTATQFSSMDDAHHLASRQPLKSSLQCRPAISSIMFARLLRPNISFIACMDSHTILHLNATTSSSSRLHQRSSTSLLLVTVPTIPIHSAPTGSSSFYGFKRVRLVILGYHQSSPHRHHSERHFTPQRTSGQPWHGSTPTGIDNPPPPPPQHHRNYHLSSSHKVNSSRGSSDRSSNPSRSNSNRSSSISNSSGSSSGRSSTNCNSNSKKRRDRGSGGSPLSQRAGGPTTAHAPVHIPHRSAFTQLQYITPTTH